MLVNRWMNNNYLSRNVLTYSSNSLTANITASEISYDIKIKQLHARQVCISFLKETTIPLNILRNNSSLEAIVMYMKDILGMKFNRIAELLNRNQKSIWVTYANAKKKQIILDVNNDSQLNLPISIFVSRNFSILETIVFYLRNNHNLSFNQISDLLGKNYRTIWTVHKRVSRKLEHEHKHEQ